MELLIHELRIPVEKDGTDEYIRCAGERLGICPEQVSLARILSKSLDMRDAAQFFYLVSLVVRVQDDFDNKAGFPLYREEETFAAGASRRPEQRPIIIGFGPAGMFAALQLVERGIRPLIFERGKKIEERTPDVEAFIAQKSLNPESNIQFGEGGAGAYSDGKIFSRVNNSKYVRTVLDVFVRFGAPEEIRYIHKPHLGTDVLCAIVKNIRNHILARGGEIFYGSKMTDVLMQGPAARGVIINGEKEYHSSHIYLAVGHSARDTFEMLYARGVAMAQKPIAVGVRIEHPAALINRIRYGEKYRDFPALGAATYSFNYTDRALRRGAYTFCMCPGGEVLNASSENGLLVTNGMSYAARASAFSNAAIVVTCQPGDYGSSHPLAGISFQKSIERRAFAAGGGTWRVPAQNLIDYLSARPSRRLNAHSCRIGAAEAELHAIFPGFVNETLSAAFHFWEKDYPLFVSEQAVLFGAETRTSCPVRMLRNDIRESVTVKNLYPIGEGSAYAGGITSAAADAIRAVEDSMENI